MDKTDEPNELLDLLNDEDQVIGVVTRGEVWRDFKALRGRVRAADCFMVNDEGQIWVPRRSNKKKMMPGGLDFSVGEHVHSGETYEQAMVRGFREEVNMTIEASELTKIGVLDLRPIGLPYADAIFVYHNNSVPDYNREDFVSYEWLAAAEFLKRLEAGEPAKSNILTALRAYIAFSNKG